MRAADAVRIVVDVMGPYIGETMARSAALAHCRRLGVGETLSSSELETLLTRLGSGLNVFLGRERSAAVLAEARRALQAAGPTS